MNETMTAIGFLSTPIDIQSNAGLNDHVVYHLTDLSLRQEQKHRRAFVQIGHFSAA
jgi:hypothetical protein